MNIKLPSTKRDDRAQSESLDGAVETIIATRDFCGNEREALRDWEADNYRLSSLDRKRVLLAVEERWAYYQKQAGVTLPISKEERAEITRIMEKAP